MHDLLVYKVGSSSALELCKLWLCLQSVVLGTREGWQGRDTDCFQVHTYEDQVEG